MSKVKVAQSCPVLCDPVSCSLLGSSVYGILNLLIGEYFSTTYVQSIQLGIVEDTKMQGKNVLIVGLFLTLYFCLCVKHTHTHTHTHTQTHTSH